MVTALASGTPVEIQLLVLLCTFMWNFAQTYMKHVYQTFLTNVPSIASIWFHPIAAIAQHLHVPTVHVARCAHWQHQAPETRDCLLWLNRKLLQK